MAKKRHPLADLAKKAVEKYIRQGKVFRPRKLSAEMRAEAGVFVSIKKHGELRGCIGTFLPTKKNVAEEIVANAIAATQDPRFPPLSKEELPYLTYKVDALSDLRPVSKRELDPKKYGLLVSTKDGRRGLLLPDLPGVDTVDQQISYCLQKAGIRQGEKVDYQIFTVERHE